MVKKKNQKHQTREISQNTKRAWKHIFFIILLLGAVIVGFQTSLYAMALGIIIGFLIGYLEN